jgi:hypothetical protein
MSVTLAAVRSTLQHTTQAQPGTQWQIRKTGCTISNAVGSTEHAALLMQVPWLDTWQWQ